MYIKRRIEALLDDYLQIFPVVSVLGPRQCGKSTLVQHVLKPKPNTIFLDLQNVADRNKLSDPYLFFQMNASATICIDEIQLLPELFSVLRSVVDQDRRKGRFVLTGSASRALVQQSSESLAGRIGYLSLTPFLINELPNISLMDYWNRGGFPDSVLAANDAYSAIWRENFIKTYVERDIPELGFQIPSLQLMRFLKICAHQQGQTVNLSKISRQLELTHPTIRRYVDLLEQTFVLRTLTPLEANTQKRLIKSPKVYVRDTGILHQLLGIPDGANLFAHPVFGPSWEGLVIEMVLNNFEVPHYFYRTAKGVEMDLILDFPKGRVAIECKAAAAPQPTKGFYTAIADLAPIQTFIVAPIDGTSYHLSENIVVTSLPELLQKLQTAFS